MNGAREYASLFNEEQHGRLYLVPGSHARGRTFDVWVLPNDQPVNPRALLSSGAVKVYGAVGGQPGWTEYYGWIHRGPWEADFQVLVKKRKAEIATKNKSRAEAELERKEAEEQRVRSVLDSYGA